MSGSPTFDQLDQQILDKRIEQWNQQPAPRVGDFILMKDGTKRRFTHDWGDRLQTTLKDQGGSFYFAGDHMSYSGGLDYGVPRCELKDTGETESGRVWFFHHDHHTGHNG